MRIATYDDKHLVVNILKKTFLSLDFPNSINFVVKQGRNRARRIHHLMEYQFDVAQKFGKIYLSNNEESCAMLIFSEKKRNGLIQLFWDFKLAIRCIGLKNVPKVLKRETQIKKQHPKTPYLHFWIMATIPEMQGKGSGSKLLKEILNLYSRFERPICLETTTNDNLRFYQKHGFRITHKTTSLNYPLFFLEC